jgi:hypothetical protein
MPFFTLDELTYQVDISGLSVMGCVSRLIAAATIAITQRTSISVPHR